MLVTTVVRCALLCVPVCMVAACTEPPVVEGSEGEGEAGEGEGEGEAAFAISTKASVAWKRHRAVENDLLTALALQKSELCNELGLYSCVDFVHTVALGGNEPFAKSQYEPLASPTVTSPIALDRVVLSGCIARVDKDLAGPAVVFTTLALGATSVDDTEALATADALGRRLLGRELLEAERTIVASLADDDDGTATSARDFAIAACVAVGTMAETVIY